MIEPASSRTEGASTRLHEVEALYCAAIEADEPMRQVLLAEADPAIRSAVNSLLSLSSRAEVLLERPAWRIAVDGRGSGAGIRLPAGTRAGQFTVVEEIGRGGMGVVYRATQDRPRREVAVKALACPFPSEGAVRRFVQESEVLGRLHHPAIATVIAAGAIEGAGGTIPYFAMELVQGTPITRFAADAELGAAARLLLLAQVCDGLEHAHHRGVIHRDIKPANILVDAAGRPKILDFGVAHVARGEAMATTMGGLVGTYAYMAPEQLRGNHDVDTRSDLYALGVVTYQLLVGRLPYATPPRDIVEAGRVVGEPGMIVPPSRVDRRLRGDLESVLLRALEFDPVRRYQSAGAFAADLRALARHEPVAAAPPTAWRMVRLYARRHRVLVAVAAAVGVLVPIGAAATAWQARIAHANAAQAEDRSQRLATLVTQLSYGIAQAAEYMPRTGPHREKLLEQGIAALERLAAERPDDHALRSTLAVGLSQLATLQGDPSRPNLSQTEQAAATVRRAIAMWSADPDLRSHLERWRAFARAHGTLGRILAATDPESAAAAFAAAHRETLAILAVAPGMQEARVAVGYLLKLRAEYAPSESALRALAADFRVSRESLESARRRAPATTPEDAILDADGVASLAEAAVALGWPEAANELLDLTESILEPHARTGAWPAEGRLCNMGRARAKVAEMRGDRAGAIAILRRTVERYDATHPTRPDDYALSQGRFMAWADLADALIGVEEGNEVSAKALALARGMMVADPETGPHREALARALRSRIAWLAESGGGKGDEERDRLEAELAELESS